MLISYFQEFGQKDVIVHVTNTLPFKIFTSPSKWNISTLISRLKVGHTL